MRSKLRIELGPLHRVRGRVEFGWCDDRVKAEIRGGNVQSRERMCFRRCVCLLLVLGLGGVGEDRVLVAVVVAHCHGYGERSS